MVRGRVGDGSGGPARSLEGRLDMAVKWPDQVDWRRFTRRKTYPIASYPYYLRIPGGRLWLVSRRRVQYSVAVAGIERRDSTLVLEGMSLACRYVLKLVADSGRVVDRPLGEVEDPDGVAHAWPWDKGWRYLQPGGHAFVRTGERAGDRTAGRRPRRIALEDATVEEYRRTATEERVARRREARLVDDYRRFLGPPDGRLCRYEIPLRGVPSLFTDAYDTKRHLLIEAKASVRRQDIRMAIGQLFDYARYLSPRPRLAVLTPDQPTDELLKLLREHQIAAIWRTQNGFTEVQGGRLGANTTRQRR
jgi:hypothetical protein